MAKHAAALESSWLVQPYQEDKSLMSQNYWENWFRVFSKGQRAIWQVQPTRSFLDAQPDLSNSWKHQWGKVLPRPHSSCSVEKEASYELELPSELQPSLERICRKRLQVQLGVGRECSGNDPVSITEAHLGLAFKAAASSSAQFRGALCSHISSPGDWSSK